ncbi:unnamed protein product [Alopecurus aequalis]
MDSPPLNGDQDDEDRISALPDDLLVGILERIDLPTAIRASAVSTRWRHLPHQLSRLRLKASRFHGATIHQIMRAYTGALWKVLNMFPPPTCNCPSAVRSLRLHFYVSDPQLNSIGLAVEDVVRHGETQSLKFGVGIYAPDTSKPAIPQLAAFGQLFMSFSGTYPVAFRWLTMLCLKNLAFRDSNVADLIRACHRLRRLSLKSCGLVDRHATLKIDAPCSGLQKIEFTSFRCTRIELISVPKLRKVRCYWYRENPPVRFGYIPELREVSLSSHAKTWQAPFALSECFSTGAENLSTLYPNFRGQMIWIKPEHPKQLTAIFSKLTDVHLSGIFPECDLSWTLFILEAAPSLKKFTVSRNRHLCAKTTQDSAEKTNMTRDPPKDLKHVNLKLLVMEGFEDEEKVTNYIRLVMERAVGLRRIKLCGSTCVGCKTIDHESTRSQMDEVADIV